MSKSVRNKRSLVARSNVDREQIAIEDFQNELLQHPEAEFKIKKRNNAKSKGSDEYEQLKSESFMFKSKVLIEKAASFIAAQRNVRTGQDVSDWFESESDIELRLRPR